jgi:hypothetical protein
MNDEEFDRLVDRINAVVELLREELKEKSEASSRQMEKVCQSFHEYVPAPTKPVDSIPREP